MNIIGTHVNNRIVSFFCIVFFLLITGAAQSSSQKQDLRSLETYGVKKLGSGVFNWWGFDLYTATYYADSSSTIIDKTFSGWQRGKRAVLQINYHRKISSSQLINATQTIWQRMGISLTEYESYISSLQKIWPDVKKNDIITLSIDEKGKSVFYLNSSFLGEINASKFSLAFISIWTSLESPHQELRKSLLGFNKNLIDT